MSIRKRDKDDAKKRFCVHGVWRGCNEYNAYRSAAVQLILTDKNGNYLIPVYRGRGYYIQEWFVWLHNKSSQRKRVAQHLTKKRRRSISKKYIREFIEDSDSLYASSIREADPKYAWY